MRASLLLCLCLTIAVAAQERVVFEDEPALRLSNDKLELLAIGPVGE